VLEGLAEHVPHVYRFALRLSGDVHRAEDLTQETFLRAWKGREKLKDNRAARVWLFRIAANLWKDDLRRSETRTEDSQAESFTVSASASAERMLESREELEQALKMLDSLPPRQRAVLYLAAVEELSLGDIGEILQITYNDAKVNLSLARKRMRERVAKPR
jgi:RNA polymerase sigma-70 factor (ECF subfamily)